MVPSAALEYLRAPSRMKLEPNFNRTTFVKVMNSETWREYEGKRRYQKFNLNAGFFPPITK